MKGKEVFWLLWRLRETPRPFSSIIVAIVCCRPDQNVECENMKG